MALHPTFDVHLTEYRDPHDLAPLFWRIAIPACLLFWAAVAYGIHSAT